MGGARKSRTNWKAFDAKTPAQVRAAIERDPDARPTTPEFWKGGKVRHPEPKQSVTIRLDADVVRFFKQEDRYQTKINEVLRDYMQAHEGR